MLLYILFWLREVVATGVAGVFLFIVVFGWLAACGNLGLIECLFQVRKWARRLNARSRAGATVGHAFVWPAISRERLKGLFRPFDQRRRESE